MRWWDALIDATLGRWLVYWHGASLPHEYQFYRCKGCRSIVTRRHIHTGGCPCQESSQISPAMLRRGEKVRLVLLPWTITSPRVRRDSAKRLAVAR